MINKENPRSKTEGSNKERKQKTGKKDRRRKQRICKEIQMRKTESRRQGQWNTGKERLKRIGSEKT